MIFEEKQKTKKQLKIQGSVCRAVKQEHNFFFKEFPTNL